ncbi:hypothetical protein Lepto7376_2826 [[Leptolyngbya] sp. PCC 7376]|uniref:hypothetical protein n=1 Tax=[Leptolyngbya] sp. PCC 7376 TaxID=111781 RepID=UPI00029F391E|nr:hypothetical protein [[Leptolyngbya] sp. PCC 7376]AFY39083.1 hypothetical protein Lepto7376_2826 [[Leptolyngbya] sp. PCC 7376]
MSEAVVQWLGEINRLKQQLATLQQELQTSQKNEASWRQRYTEEAQQRRTEARLAKEQFEQIQLTMRTLQQDAQLTPGQLDNPELEQEIKAIADLEELQERLISTEKERHQALADLAAEQEAHEQTRKSLTSVINDTIEQLGKVKKESPTP